MHSQADLGRLTSRPDRLELLPDLPPARHQVVIGLQLQKKSIAQAEIAGEPQVCVGGDGALAEHDLVDAPRRHADGARQRRLRQRHRLQEFLEQNFAGLRIGQKLSRGNR
jgi:hypothetical protein